MNQMIYEFLENFNSNRPICGCRLPLGISKEYYRHLLWTKWFVNFHIKDIQGHPAPLGGRLTKSRTPHTWLFLNDPKSDMGDLDFEKLR